LKEFEKSIKGLEKIFTEIELKIEKRILLKAIDILRDEETKNSFIENYKKARKLFEILGSFPGKLKYLDKFKWFTTVYEYWKKLTGSEEKREKIEQFFRRTLEAIHQNTEIQRIGRALPAVVLDIKYLTKIQKSALTQEEKAVNILFALEKLVLVEQRQNPAYRSIVDRLNELIRKWKERKIDYRELLNEEEKIIGVVESNEKKREELDLSHFDFGLLLTLQENLKEREEEKVRSFVSDITALIKEDLIENWQENPTLRQNIERKIREYLLRLKQEYELSYDEFDSLHKKLVSFINDYGS